MIRIALAAFPLGVLISLAFALPDSRPIVLMASAPICVDLVWAVKDCVAKGRQEEVRFRKELRHGEEDRRR